MIVLPELCGTRGSAERLLATHRLDGSVRISLQNTTSVAQGFCDELCKQLMIEEIKLVELVSPSERFIEYFMRAHRLRKANFEVKIQN